MSSIAAANLHDQGKSAAPLKVFVAIASYGTANNKYLHRVIREYRSMPFEVDIVVLSNERQEPIPGAEIVLVDLRRKNSWSLPFPHKQMFAERLNEYDLFIYSENDTAITEKNIKAFVEICESLPENEIVGFVRYESGPNGCRNYPDIHGQFHWDSQSVRRRSKEIFAHLTNEHSGCYILTRQQLRRAIDSGGFLVEPHAGKYDLLCTAATDPYTQCGFQKLICVSRLDDLLVHHLSDRYVDTSFGIQEPEFRRQIERLLQIEQTKVQSGSFFVSQGRMPSAWYAKNYYEPIRDEIISLLPKDVRKVLSIGCGWGALEGHLVEKGLQVVAIPLDPVIAGAAEAKGVEVLSGNLEAVQSSLARHRGQRFDCLLTVNILHLVRDPVALLRSFRDLLSDKATIVVETPNFLRPPNTLRMLHREPGFMSLIDYDRGGTHFASRQMTHRWLKRAGMVLEKTVAIMKPSLRTFSKSLLSLPEPFLADGFVAIARPKARISSRVDR
jgi:2-polyprenyl-3-methyl-5-hydroxy-6-metoxy-1,4-benzoquinol methylase